MEEALAHPYLEAYVRFSVCCLFLELLPHIYYSSFLFSHPHNQHDPDDEPVAPPLDPEFFEFDRQCFLLVIKAVYIDTPYTTVHKDDISREQLKELLYEEIMSFQPAPIT